MAAAQKAIEKLLVRRTKSNRAVVANYQHGTGSSTVMEHLACFTPGMLALGHLTPIPKCICLLIACTGVHEGIDDVSGSTMAIAKGLTKTCWEVNPHSSTLLEH